MNGWQSNQHAQQCSETPFNTDPSSLHIAQSFNTPKKAHVFSGLLCPAWDAGKTSEGTPDEELICIKFNTARVDAGTNMNASRSRHRTRCRA